MKTIIHVNQHVIKSNKRLPLEDVEPVLTVKTYKDNRYAAEAVIRDDDGNEVARVVYRPHKPLSCGAHCWIETNLKVDTYSKHSGSCQRDDAVGRRYISAYNRTRR